MSLKNIFTWFKIFLLGVLFITTSKYYATATTVYTPIDELAFDHFLDSSGVAGTHDDVPLFKVFLVDSAKYPFFNPRDGTTSFNFVAKESGSLTVLGTTTVLSYPNSNISIANIYGVNPATTSTIPYFLFPQSVGSTTFYVYFVTYSSTNTIVNVALAKNSGSKFVAVSNACTTTFSTSIGLSVNRISYTSNINTPNVINDTISLNNSGISCQPPKGLSFSLSLYPNVKLIGFVISADMPTIKTQIKLHYNSSKLINFCIGKVNSSIGNCPITNDNLQCSNHCKICGAASLCLQCPVTSSGWKSPNSGLCLQEFVDINKFRASAGISEVLNANVPASDTMDYTVDFWIYIKKTVTPGTQTLTKIIYKDYFSVGVLYTSGNLRFYCVPLEYRYSINTLNDSEVDSITNALNNPSWSGFSVIGDSSSGLAKWHYVRCQFSLEMLLKYIKIDETVPTETAVVLPMWNDFDSSTLPTSFRSSVKRFYQNTATTKLSVVSPQNAGNEIYIKNLNAFYTYMPIAINWKFYNIYKSDVGTFPLIFSIPFTDESDSQQPISSTIVNLGIYSFIDRTSKSSIKTSLKITLTFNTLDSIFASTQFRRLNLLNLDGYFFDYELNTIISTSPNPYADFMCPPGVNKFMSGSTCTTSCDTNTFRAVQPVGNNNYFFCTESCLDSDDICPNTIQNIPLGNSQYSCAVGKLKYNFGCFQSVDTNKTGLRFGTSLNTPGIKITVNTTPTIAFTDYTIDVWIYNDYFSDKIPDISIEAGTYRIFLTNAFSIDYNFSSKSIVLTNGGSSLTKLENPNYGWKHLVISVNSNKQIYMSLYNKLEPPLTINNPLSNLANIFFCNAGYNNSECNSGNWMDLYYSQLRIFKSCDYTAALSSDNSPYMNKLSLFDFTLKSMQNNIISCNPCFDGASAIVDYQNTFTTYDSYSNISIGSYFAHDHLSDGVGKYMNKPTISYHLILNRQMSTCNAKCSKCYGGLVSQCFDCVAGATSYNKACTSSGSNSGKYVFKNSYTYNSPLNLQFSLSIDNEATFFMFLRLYYVQIDSDKDLVILNSSDSLRLIHNVNGQLCVKMGNQILFEPFDASTIINYWVPISISTYKTKNGINYINYKSIISHTIGQDLRLYNNASLVNTIINQVSIVNSFAGLISHVTLFNSFIVNAYGFIKRVTDFNPSSEIKNFFDYMGIQSETRFLRKDDQSSCQALSEESVICIEDYNPYIEYTAAVNGDLFYLDSASTPSVTTSVDCCKNNLSINCMKINCDTTSDTQTMVQAKSAKDSCDNNFTTNRMLVYFAPNDFTAYCQIFKYGLNFNRFQPIVFNMTPQSSNFRVVFDFSAQEYGIATSPTAIVNFSLKWNTYIEINIIKRTVDMYEINCFGMGGTKKVATALNDINKIKIQVSCGVDSTNKRLNLMVSYYNGVNQTPINLEDNQSSDITMTTWTSATAQSFTISDNSDLHYGLTSMPILEVYDGYLSILNQVSYYKFLSDQQSIKSTRNFVSVTPLNTINVNLVDRVGFLGYFPFYDTPLTLPQTATRKCTTVNEFSYLYFKSFVSPYCGSIYNYNASNSNLISFANIPLSQTYYRYSMAFWIFIDDISQFTSPLSFVYNNHMIIQLNSNNGSIKSKCVPFILENINGFPLDTASSLVNLISSTSPPRSSDESTSMNGVSSWSLQICSVDVPLGKYYVNANAIKYLTPFTQATSTSTNTLYYREFNNITSQTTFFVNGLTASGSRIFLSQLTIFRDYIGKDLYSNLMLFKDFSTAFGDSQFKELVVFNTDFINSVVYANNSATISYKTMPETGIADTRTLAISVPLVSKTYLKSSSIVNFELCSMSMEKDKTSVAEANLTYDYLSGSSCVDIGNGSCLNTTEYCLRTPFNSNAFYYFWCSSPSKYLDTKTLACTSANSRFKIGSKLNDFVLSDFDLSDEDTCTNNTNFQFYHQCLPKSMNPYLYFNNVYSFKDLIVPLDSAFFSGATTYGLEVWFYSGKIPNSESDTYYFIAEPHRFYASAGSSNFNYLQSANGTQQFTSTVNVYEWNTIYISSTSANTQIYFNYGNPGITTTSSAISNLAFCNKSSTCSFSGTSFNGDWANVIYSHIKIYKSPFSIDLIQAYSKSTDIAKLSSFLTLYFDFSLTNLNLNSGNKNEYQFQNKITSAYLPNIKIIGLNNYRPNNMVDDSFDYVGKNLKYGKFISNTNLISPSDADLSACSDPNCKRCFNLASCYECNTNYMLTSDLKCRKASGSFFKSTLVDVRLDLQNNIEDHNKLTTIFYFKASGPAQLIPSATLGAETLFKMVSFNDLGTCYFAYSLSSQNMFLVINNKIAYKLINPTYSLGAWYFFSFSYYRSSNISFIPHYASFYIGRSLISENAPFSSSTESITFNRFILNKDASGLYSDVRIYSSFLKSPFGLIKGTNAPSSTYLIEHFQLTQPIYDNANIAGTTIFNPTLNPTNCVNSNDLYTSSQLGLIPCILDYDAQFDPSLVCSSNIKLLADDQCTGCQTICQTPSDQSLKMGCISSVPGDMSCSCFIHRNSYFFTDNERCFAQSTVPLNYLEDISATVKSTTTLEMTAEFWYFSYSYFPVNFYGVEFVWDNHARIKIENVDADNFKITGYPLAYLSYPNEFSATNPNDKTVKNGSKSVWHFIRLSASFSEPIPKFYMKLDTDTPLIQNISPLPPASYTDILSSPNNVGLSLKMLNVVNPNYGFTYVNNIRLYSAYLFPSTITNYNFLMNSNLGYLLYNFYLPASGLKDDPTDTSFIDLKNDSPTFSLGFGGTIINFASVDLTTVDGIARLPSSILTYFTSCPDGKRYDGASCSPLVTTCSIGFDVSSIATSGCIKCPDSQKYLHEDALCYALCPPTFYGNDSFGMCRKCHAECVTCNGSFNSNCLTCPVGQFLLRINGKINGNCLSRCSDNYLIEDTITDPLIPLCMNCNNQCNNFNTFNDLEFSITTNPQIAVDSYSLGIWIFIDDISAFNVGFNVVYEKHIGLHIRKVNTYDIESTCFPQGYRIDLSGKTNYVTDILPLLSTATNSFNTTKFTQSFASKDGSWIFLLCAASISKGQYYHNSSPINIFKSGDSNLTATYREFNTWIPADATYKAKIQNASASGARIFLKNFMIFKDFLPQSIYSNNLFYRDLTLYTNFKELLFFVDIPLLKTNPTLTYKTYNPTNLGSLYSSQTVTPSISAKVYASSSKIIDLKLCDLTKTPHSASLQIPIYSKDLICDALTCPNGEYCINNTMRFLCNTGLSLNIDTLACESTSTTFTRHPNSVNYKTLDCAQKGYSVCPPPTYIGNSSINCGASNTKFFFDCITTTKLANSALYFSSYYSFQNIQLDYTSMALNQYVIEFWMYIDNSSIANSTYNSFLKSTDKYYYFILFPHSIYAKYTSTPQTNNSLKFYYNLNNIDYELTTKNVNEWVIFYISVANTFTPNNKQVKVYSNFNFTTPDVSVTNSSGFDFSLKKLVFCSHLDPNLVCSATSDTTNKWGFAFYKNIRVWKNSYNVSPRLIQESSQNPVVDTSNTMLLSHFDFTLDKFNFASPPYFVKDTITALQYDITQQIPYNPDYDKSFNYSIDFDLIKKNGKESKYLSTNLNNISLSYTSCPTGCLRCFTSTTCYQCSDAYYLIADSCIIKSKTFLKAPNSSGTLIELKVSSLGSPPKKLEDLSKLTISFYMKLMSNSPTSVSTDRENPFLFLNSNILTNKYVFVFERDDTVIKGIKVYLKGILAFKFNISDANTTLINKWNLITISYTKGITSFIYPQLQFQINRNLVPLEQGFTVASDYVFNYLALTHQIYALYYNIQIFNSYMVRPYGIIKSKSFAKAYLLKTFDLSSDVPANKCISAVDIANINDSPLSSIDCITDDYSDFLNKQLVCDDDQSYMFFDNYVKKGDYSCLGCNNNCKPVIPPSDYSSSSNYNLLNLSCSGNSNTECSCDISRYSFYQLNDTCRAAKSTNFAFVNKNSQIIVKQSQNNEATLEFWVNIYSYMPEKFKTIEIAWNGHVGVKLQNDSPNDTNIRVFCDPFVTFDPTVSSSDIKYSMTTSSNTMNLTFPENGWKFIRCSLDRRPTKEKYYLNKDSVSPFALDNYSANKHADFLKANEVTNSIIEYPKDNFKYIHFRIRHDNDPNFGFLYIRHLKILSAYLSQNFKTEDKRLTFKIATPNYLFHYYGFENTLVDLFNSDGQQTYQSNEVKIYDYAVSDNSKDFYTLSLSATTGSIGYGKLSSDADIGLVVCEENQILQNGSCTTSSGNCAIQASNGGCLVCQKSQKYLSDTNFCYATCPDGFYGDDFLNMCRDCNLACFKCTGPLDVDCLSCSSPNYTYTYQNDAGKQIIQCIADCKPLNQGLVNYPFDGSLTNRNCVVPNLNANIAISNFDITETQNPYLLKAIIVKIEAVVVSAAAPDAKTSTNQVVYDLTYPAADFTNDWVFAGIQSVTEKFDISSNTTNPSTSKTKYLTFNLTSGYLERGKDYSIDISLNSEYMGLKLSYSKKLTFKTGNKPQNLNLTIGPRTGISDKTDYSVTCDTSDPAKSTLTYLISYNFEANDVDLTSEFDKRFESTPPNADLQSGEIAIINREGTTGYSKYNSIVSKFTVDSGAKNQSIYKVYCTTQDKSGLLYKIGIRIIVTKFSSESYKESINTLINVDADGNWSYNQDNFSSNSFLTNSKMLKSIMAISYSKLDSATPDLPSQSGLAVEETQINPNNYFVVLAIPVCNNSYCNGGGNCTLTADVMTCDCNEEYKGKNCLLKDSDYDKYSQVFMDTVKSQKERFLTLTPETNEEVIDTISGIKNMVTGGASFLNLDDAAQMSSDAAEIIDHALTQFPSIAQGSITDIITTLDNILAMGVSNILGVYSNDKKVSQASNNLNTLIPKISKNSSQANSTNSTSQSSSANSNSTVVNKSSANSNSTLTRMLNAFEEKYKEKRESYYRMLPTVDTASANSSNTTSSSSSQNSTQSQSKNTSSNNSTDSTSNSTSSSNNTILSPELKQKYKIFFDTNQQNLKNILYKMIMSDSLTTYTYDSIVDFNQDKVDTSVISSANEMVAQPKASNSVFNNLYIQLVKLKSVPNLDTYLALNKAKYYPYVELENCIADQPGLNRNNLGLVLINFKISPYLYDEDSYFSNVSIVLTVDLVDLTTGKKLSIKNCGSDITNRSVLDDPNNKNAKIYFPIKNKDIPQVINNWINFLNPDKQLSLNSDYFREPFYIDTTGEVLNLTISERIAVSYVPMNFTCTYIDDVTKKFMNTGIIYSNYTQDSYFQCQSSHLTDFSLAYTLNPTDVNALSKFYFIGRFELYAWPQNFSNIAFYLFLIAIVISIFLIILSMALRKKSFLDLKNLKDTIIKLNLPYLNNYMFGEFGFASPPDKLFPNISVSSNTMGVASGFPSSDRGQQLFPNQSKCDIEEIGASHANDNKSISQQSPVQIVTNQLLSPSPVKSKLLPSTNQAPEELQLNIEMANGNGGNNLSQMTSDPKYHSNYLLKQSQNNGYDVIFKVDQSSTNRDGISIVSQAPKGRAFLKLNSKIDLAESTQELKKYSELSAFEYFKINIRLRHFALLDYYAIQITPQRSIRRISLVTAYFSIIALCSAIIICSDKRTEITSLSDLFGQIITSAILGVLITNLYTDIISALASISTQSLRNLYCAITENDVKLLNELKLNSRVTFGKILFFSFNLLVFLISFHICFTYCAVYKFQQSAWIIAILLTLIVDTCSEVLVEFFMAVLYKNKHIKVFLSALTLLERIRNSRRLL